MNNSADPRTHKHLLLNTRHKMDGVMLGFGIIFITQSVLILWVCWWLGNKLTHHTKSHVHKYVSVIVAIILIWITLGLRTHEYIFDFLLHLAHGKTVWEELPADHTPSYN